MLIEKLLIANSKVAANQHPFSITQLTSFASAEIDRPFTYAAGPGAQLGCPMPASSSLADLSMGSPVVYLLDVDNTLLDNDRVVADLMRHLDRIVGHDSERRYWDIFERLREKLGYADYLGALQSYRVEQPRDPNILKASSFLINYPFANRLFPNSLDVIDQLKGWGPVVILSDGDVVFQPRKIERSGLWEAVDGRC